MVALLFAAASAVVADTLPDYERESRIAEQIEPDIFDGDAVWLSANDHDFLAIHIEVDDPKGTIVLLHGRDVSPEEQHLIGPLRVGLSEHGWNTLALQMPVLAKGKTYEDYLPIFPLARKRIDAALTFLSDQGEQRIVIAAHSCGAHMTNNWLNHNSDERIDAYIAMGLGATDAGQALQTPFPIADMRVPVLDIYGAQEFPRPLAMIPERRAMLKANGHPHSTQIEVEGANHYFHDAGEIMVERVANWLSNL